MNPPSASILSKRAPRPKPRLGFQYDYERPAVTVDCVVFGFDEFDLKVLLIQRDLAPFENQWALPGGFVRMEETLEDAARRELHEEAGLSDVFLEQLYTFGDPGRDPRDRVVTVAYYALVKLSEHTVRAAGDAKNAAWYPVSDLPELAFDHSRILLSAVERLKGKVRYEPIGFELLPKKFTLSRLQHLYEVCLGRSLDKRNFRKKISSMQIFVELSERETGVPHRAARLYRFDEKRYRTLKQNGFNFEI